MAHLQRGLKKVKIRLGKLLLMQLQEEHLMVTLPWRPMGMEFTQAQ